MIVTNYKPVNKGCLLGFMDVQIPQWSLEIRSISLFQKNGRRWISMPAKKIEQEGEEDKYFQYVKFTEPDVKERFEKACLKALDEYIMNAQ